MRRTSSALRATAGAILVVPALTMGAGWAALGDPASGSAWASPWPWGAAGAAFCLALALAGRWAGVSDWGYIPFCVTSAIAVPWWGASIAAYLFLVAPAGPVAGIGFWFLTIGLLALLSQLAG